MADEQESTYDLMTWDELKKLMDEEDAKKNFRNWINHKFPKGYAGYNIHYLLMHPWKIVRHWMIEIKYAWQRVFNKYDETVVWSIDGYLADMMPIWIGKLKRTKTGIPVEMFDGLPHDENYVYSSEDEKLAEKRWDEILDKIIEGFEAAKKIQDYDRSEEVAKKFDEGFDLFKKHFFSLWD